MDWGREWEITCTRVRIMMLKRGIESIPITSTAAETRIDRFLAKMLKARRNWAENKKMPPLECRADWTAMARGRGKTSTPIISKTEENAMKKTTVWHPYPAEKPPKSGEYIVTTAFNSCGFDCRHVTVGINWSQEHEAWNARDYADPDYAFPNVVAWAYMDAFLPYMDGGDGRPVAMV